MDFDIRAYLPPWVDLAILGHRIRVTRIPQSDHDPSVDT